MLRPSLRFLSAERPNHSCTFKLNWQLDETYRIGLDSLNSLKSRESKVHLYISILEISQETIQMILAKRPF